MNETPDIQIEVDRQLFFGIGRSLQRGFGNDLLGDVVLIVRGNTLAILSDWGGGELACSGGSNVETRLSAKSFCQLITSRYRETRPQGQMVIIFRPSLKEVAIDRLGVRAKFAVTKKYP